eukprot:scaffold206225_cov25-Prasinocladus_malaysianus.AAC.1
MLFNACLAVARLNLSRKSIMHYMAGPQRIAVVNLYVSSSQSEGDVRSVLTKRCHRTVCLSLQAVEKPISCDDR